MANQTQISAYISKTTKSLVEEYTEHYGVKKAHLVEEALLHHIQALRELPADLVIPLFDQADIGRVADEGLAVSFLALGVYAALGVAALVSTHEGCADSSTGANGG